jgi:hypothetical protein
MAKRKHAQLNGVMLSLFLGKRPVMITSVAYIVVHFYVLGAPCWSSFVTARQAARTCGFMVASDSYSTCVLADLSAEHSQIDP